MLRKHITNMIAVRIILCLQALPLLLFPPSSYSTKTQEWWLPVFLTVLVIISVVKLLLKRDSALWPWFLISFSQGFNIISRLMMLMPHATVIVEGEQAFNAPYVGLTVLAMLMSAFVIWYSDLPEVRNRVLA
jgi:hypothetical protein